MARNPSDLSHFPSLHAHFKAENASLRQEVKGLKRKLVRTETALTEIAMKVRNCCAEATAKRILEGSLEEMTESSGLSSFLSTFIDTSLSSSPVPTELCDSALPLTYRRKLAGLESKLDAQMRKADKTLRMILEKLPVDSEMFDRALGQIRNHWKNEGETDNASGYIDELVKKVNVLSAYETLQQSALRYDILTTERLFSTISDVILTSEFSLLSLLHSDLLPASSLLEVDTLVSRRVDLLNEVPTFDSLTQLLSLLEQYQSLYRALISIDRETTGNVCDVITIAHKMGQLTSDSQRNLMQLTLEDALDSRVHTLQNSLLMAKASLVATETGTVEYINRLFQIVRDQDYVKFDILRNFQDRIAESEEKCAKTATELQTLAMEMLSFVTQMTSFSKSPDTTLAEMITILPENENSIVSFAEEVREKCEKMIKSNGELEETEGEFVMEMLKAVEETVEKWGEVGGELDMTCKRLKRQVEDCRYARKTRIMPWKQTKDLVIRAFQLLGVHKARA